MDALAEKLAQACKVLADDGQGDLIWGHVTARTAARPDRLLMKPAGIGLEEMEREEVITVDLGGEQTSGTRPRHVEVFIHTEIMRARPEIQAVVHTHPPHAVAFSSLCRPLLPIGHEGALFCDGLPVFDRTSDLIVTSELGRDVTACLGDHSALLLRNHGIVSVGRSIEEAVMTAVLLEKACRVQLMAEQAGGAKATTSRNEAQIKRERIYSPQSLQTAFEYCVRRYDMRHANCAHHRSR
ncbi:MAG TPA: class II aldolase/adducin family protein [Dongiaceae bacterium]|jgi:L-fuculose-phosphate aldolase|nr:class II aldolase/adducin family protein [Dongiaceae bacterium]